MNALDKHFDHLADDRDEHDLLRGIEPIVYARFVRRSSEVKTTRDFIALIKTAVQAILPHEMFLAGVGYAQGKQIVVRNAIGINYPQHYVNSLRSDAVLTGPILARWLMTREPQWFDRQYGASVGLQRWVQALSRNNIRNVLGYGVKDLTGTGASYFTFANVSRPQEQVQLMQLLIPQLHAALCRVVIVAPHSQTAHDVQLSQREMEVLKLIAAGKSDMEIAGLLHRSTLTIKTHVQRIREKLGVSKRAEAVAIASTRNWISVNAPLNRVSANDW